MARTLREAPLTTATARSGLTSGVHWRRLDSNTHLGYRSGVRQGIWLVRWRIGSRYRQERLGTADDFLPADGASVLSFDQAQRAARLKVIAVRDAEAAAQKSKAQNLAGPPPRVESVVREYAARVCAPTFFDCSELAGWSADPAGRQFARHIVRYDRGPLQRTYCNSAGRTRSKSRCATRGKCGGDQTDGAGGLSLFRSSSETKRSLDRARKQRPHHLENPVPQSGARFPDCGGARSKRQPITQPRPTSLPGG